MKIFLVFMFLVLNTNQKFRRLMDEELKKDERYQYVNQLPVEESQEEDEEDNDEEENEDEDKKYDVESLKDPEYFMEEENEDEEEHLIHDIDDTENQEDDMIEFEEQNEEEHLKNFRKISEDLKKYEEKYIECLEKIPDSSYTQREIDLCLGKDFVKVLDDIRYESMKLLSRGDAKVRDVMIDLCYVPAGEDDIKSLACDILEKDALDLLWSSLQIVQILIANKEKYTENQGEMSKPLFRNIMIQFEQFQQEFFELLNEIDDHKEITLLKLKSVVDDRTKLIRVQQEKNQQQDDQEAEVQKHEIIIEETEELPQEQSQFEAQDNDEILDEGDGDSTTQENDNSNRKLQKKQNFVTNGKLAYNKNAKKIRQNTFQNRKAVLNNNNQNNLLPMHQKQQVIVRSIPNKMRLMNHNNQYTGPQHSDKVFNTNTNFRDQNFIKNSSNKNNNIVQKMLQGLSLKNKLGRSQFKNIHLYGNKNIRRNHRFNKFKQKK